MISKQKSLTGVPKTASRFLSFTMTSSSAESISTLLVHFFSGQSTYHSSVFLVLSRFTFQDHNRLLDHHSSMLGHHRLRFLLPQVRKYVKKKETNPCLLPIHELLVNSELAFYAVKFCRRHLFCFSGFRAEPGEQQPQLYPTMCGFSLR